VLRECIRRQEYEDKRLDQDELMARNGHDLGGPKTPAWPRQRPRTAALSGSGSKAPGFADGYLRVKYQLD